MANITGANSVLQAGISAWSGTPTVNTNINFTSESLTFNVNRTEEGNLLAKKAALPADVTSMNTSGSVSTILRPSMVDWVMQAITNAAGTTTSGTGNETITEYKLSAADVAGGPKHSTLELSRGGQMRKYEDVVVTNLSLTATAQDYVKADIDITGGLETKINSLTSVAAVTEKSYKCTRARLYTGDAGDTTYTYDYDACPAYSIVDGLPKFFDVSETTLSIGTGIVETPALYCSGLLPAQPTIGQRDITVNFTIPYSADIEAFYQAYYRAENAPQLSLALMFSEQHLDDEYNYLEIILPNVQINTYGGNVDSVDLINSSIGGNALSPLTGTDDPIIIRHHQHVEVPSQL